MSTPSMPTRSDRRTVLRLPSQSRGQCRLTRNTGEGPWLAAIRNVSSSGIGLIANGSGLAANRQFKRGMFLTVELPSQKGGVAKLLKVTHATAQPGSPWWVLGGTFASPLTGEEMAGLL